MKFHYIKKIFYCCVGSNRKKYILLDNYVKDYDTNYEVILLDTDFY